MPFVGELIAVHSDHVVLKHHGEIGGLENHIMASREDYPIVAKSEALKIMS